MTQNPRAPSTHSSQVQLDSIKSEILELMSSGLSPLAQRYGYDDPLQGFATGKPIVLILGNYSAGKSTLINYLVGQDIQRTGQAPTDDSFTVLTHLGGHPPGTVQTRDGRALLAENTLPLHRLKEHGERFLAHVCLKQVSSDILRNIVLIDTPGMLDSISEKDRGYEYQKVIGELASIADLVLLLFDAHKAGTVRESYLSLRDTLPRATMEDRVLFLLNRVDECQSVDDLLRVHGALCWNLSQMTGRKDIPRIFLTYNLPHAEGLGSLSALRDDLLRRYLETISSHKEEVIQQIMDIPRKRVDHLATYIEIHSHRLRLCITALKSYRKYLRNMRTSVILWWGSTALASIALIALILLGPLATPGLWNLTALSISPSALTAMLSSIVALSAATLGRIWYLMRKKNSRHHFSAHIQKYVPLDNQYDLDHWPEVKPKIEALISAFQNSPHPKQMSQDYNSLLSLERQVAAIRRRAGDLRMVSSLWPEGHRKESAPPPSPNLPQVSSREPQKHTPPKASSPEKDPPLAHIIGEQVDLLGKLDKESSKEEHPPASHTSVAEIEGEETMLIS